MRGRRTLNLFIGQILHLVMASCDGQTLQMRGGGVVPMKRLTGLQPQPTLHGLAYHGWQHKFEREA